VIAARDHAAQNPVADCSHPLTRASASFYGAQESKELRSSSQCPGIAVVRPACEHRRVKSSVDTVLLMVASTVVAMHVARWM